MQFRQINPEPTKYPRIQYREQPTKSSFFLGLILLIVGFFLMITSLNIYQPSLAPVGLRIMNLNSTKNILILGCDEVFKESDPKSRKILWKGRSDTILIFNCNPFSSTLNILSIPRDTKINLPGHGAEKINYLNSIGGPLFTKKCLEKLLGIKVDYYVMVDVKGLSKIIDQLGGLTIDVPQKMEYSDKTAMLNINLSPGSQILNGEQAIGFVRFRHDNLGDIGRIERQQIFIRALIKKLLDPITFAKIPDVISIYKETILTDLSPNEIIKTANFMRSVPRSNQNSTILPGGFGQYNSYVSYWIPDQKEINNLVQRIFLNKKSVLRFGRVNPKSIKVAVLNGSKKDNLLATKITNLLRQHGYVVLVCQDYETNVKKTKIYAQKANSELALQVKYDLGNSGELLVGNLGPLDADITILAGDDLANQIDKIKIK